MILLEWDAVVTNRLPGLTFWFAEIKGVRVAPSDERFDELEDQVIADVQQRLTLEELKDHPVVRSYRDFFWQELNIDPTKIRPAGEAIVRRVLQGKRLYRINNVVDAYYLAALRTLLAYGIFDQDILMPPLTVRIAEPGEPFQGIGMQEPKALKGQELVFADAEALVCVHPYRDADRSKVTEQTTNLLVMTGGVPGLDDNLLAEGLRVTSDYITRMAGGTAGEPYTSSAPLP